MAANPVPAPAQYGYRYLTLVQLRTMLIERLQGSSVAGYVYWSADELNRMLIESLRFFNALTTFYRERGYLEYTSISNFYDLSGGGIGWNQGGFNGGGFGGQSSVIGGPNTYGTNDLLGYHITDQQIIKEILYHILEPQLTAGGGTFTWAGTDQFDLEQVQSAVQNRLSRFLGDSGVIVNYLLQDTSSPPIREINIPDHLIDIRRANWVRPLDPTGFNQGGFGNGGFNGITDVIRYKMDRTDKWGVDSYGRSALNAMNAWPKRYIMDPATPGTMIVSPIASDVGSIELIFVGCGVPIDPTTTTTTLNLPDDYAWAVKWGALADLLSQDGQARDYRSQYCEMRYQQGVVLARAFPAVQGVQVNGIELYLQSVFAMDQFKSGWFNGQEGTPRYGVLPGRNMIALSPVPTVGLNITFDVVRNMPIPTVDGDFIQIPRDVVDVILDYAQHVASFKMSGPEWESTMKLYQNMITVAGEYNNRLKQFSFYNDGLRQAGLTQSNEVRRISIPDLRVPEQRMDANVSA